MSTKAPRETTAFINNEGQAMLVAFEKWPVPLPDQIEFQCTGDLILVRDMRGKTLAIVQASAAGGLLMSSEVYLGTVGDGEIVSLGMVRHTWK